MALVMGEATLSEMDKNYLRFADEFEREFVSQGEHENREIEETLDCGWRLLKMISRSELKRVRDEYIQKYGKREKEKGRV